MSKRITKTEAWALEIISRVQAGKRVEDTRVELKREWPDNDKAARRIAGHANSCFGSDILWIIGLDEEAGIVGVQPEELANWWPRTCSHFDAVCPALTDIVLPVDGKSLVCLLFETSRPPYVIKNPKFGSSGGGSIAWEVPWREGTSVRTAARNDLIRMLVPTIAQPEIEILQGSGNLQHKEEDFSGDKATGVGLRFTLSIYIYSRFNQAVVIPFHKCQCVLADGDSNNVIDEFNFTMYHPYSHHPRGSTPDTVTIERTSSELIAHGPGKCRIEVDTVIENEPDWLNSNKLLLRIILFVIDSELPVEIEVSLGVEVPGNNELRRWSIKGHG